MNDGIPEDLTAGLAPSATADGAELEQARAFFSELAATSAPTAFASRRAVSPALERARGAYVTETTGRAPSRSFGPFVDRVGQPVSIDLFPLMETVSVTRAGVVAPFLVIVIPIGLPPSDTVTLGGGSIWCSARAFATAAPDGWCGLRISGGTIHFGSTVTLSASPIVVPPFATVTVELQLDPPAAPTGAGPGSDARQLQLDLPSTLIVEFGPTGATVIDAAPGSTTLYGQSVTFRLGAGPAAYDTVLGRIDVPFDADVSTFAVAQCQSTLVTMAGAAPVTSAAWSLPITLGSPDSLGVAAGDGGFALALGSGLTLTWDGAAHVATAKASILLVEPGAITVEMPAARSPGGPERISLWDGPAPARQRGQLDVRFAKPFPVHYVAEATGVEAVVIVTGVSARLDPPRTINDELVRTDATAAIVAFVQTANGVFALVEANMPDGEGRAQALALKNALLLTRGPIDVALFGEYTSGRVTTGAVSLDFLAGTAVPTLPDPYAANYGYRVGERAAAGLQGRITVLISWQAAQAPRVDVVLPTNASLVRAASAPAASPSRLEAAILDVDGPALAALAERFASVAGTGAEQFALLDVSTNVSQFGVAFAPVDGGTLAVADLLVEATGTGVHVWTLPAVQWSAARY